MWQVLRRNPSAVMIAVAMHIAIIAFMVVGVDWLEQPVQPKSNVDIVQARVIDQSKVDAEVTKLKKAEADKKAKEKKRLADLKRKQDKEKQKLSELKKKRIKEEKAAAKKTADAKKKAEAKKTADAKKKAETKKKAVAKKKADAKKKAEAKKQAEAKKKADARKKIEAEKKRKAEETRKQAAAEKGRIAAEQKAREDALQAGLEAERIASERDQYLYQIKQKIENNWLRPSTVKEGLNCQLQVRLIPGGGVASVTITRSSGSGAFDRSVEQAVYKADPLPVPTGGGFEAFRDLIFNFDPSN